MSFAAKAIEPATDKEIEDFIAELQDLLYLPVNCEWPMRLVLRLKQEQGKRQS